MVVEDDDVEALKYALKVAIAKDEIDFAVASYEYDKIKMSEIERRLEAMRKILYVAL